MVNWKVRIQSPQFWMGIVGAIGAFVVSIANAFGVSLDMSSMTEAANYIITGIFTVLTLVGVISDPTTKGISDSTQAMTYTSPKVSEEVNTEQA